MNKRNRKNQRGFSLIELLIVVAIILVIAAIAIPSLLAARVSASNTQAAANLKSMVPAEALYHDNFKIYGALKLMGATNCTQTDLGTAKFDGTDQGCFISDTLANADGKPSVVVNGYNYATSGTPDTTTWAIVAFAVNPSKGQKSYCVTDDGSVRVDVANSLTAASTRATCLALPTI